MLITVIIPSLNSPIIAQVLKCIESQTAYESLLEVIVVGLDSHKQLNEGGKVRFIDTGKPVSSSRARNIGVQEASGDLLVFLDSDCLPAPGFLQAHLYAHERGHKVVGGGVMPVGENYWSLVYNLTLFHQFLTSHESAPRSFLPTLNLSVRSEVFSQLGGFDESLQRGQDLDWTSRVTAAGYTCILWPAAQVEHRHKRTTARQVWHDCARSGYFMRRIRLQHPDVLSAPGWLRYPAIILLLSPLIALGVTLRIVTEVPLIDRRFFYAIPGIYLTKLAWCWGAARQTPPSDITSAHHA